MEAALALIFLPVMFIAPLAIVLVVAYTQRGKSKKIQEACAAWAVQRGWNYYPEDLNLINRWQMSLFRQGSSRKATNVLTGQVNSKSGVVRQALSFNYQYTVSNGKSSTTYNNHIVAVFLPHYIPTLTIAPEGIGAKIAKLFGGQDIQFESEEFNERWRITGDHLAFAHAVVHPQTMEYLMMYAPGNVAYHLLGDALLIYNSGPQNLTNIDQMAWHITDLIDLVPEFVWRDYALRI